MDQQTQHPECESQRGKVDAGDGSLSGSTDEAHESEHEEYELDSHAKLDAEMVGRRLFAKVAADDRLVASILSAWGIVGR